MNVLLFIATCRLIKKTKENITIMGQTGAGLGSADEIKPGSDLATKWGESEVFDA